MLLGFDIGNTHIVPVFYDNNGEIRASFRIPTDLRFTEDTLLNISERSFSALNPFLFHSIILMTR